MFHIFKMITDRSQPKRGLGLLVGGAIVMSSMTLFSPAGILAAKGNDDDPPAIEACAGEEEAGELYEQLRARYIDLRTDTLAVKREKKTLDRGRKTLEKEIESLQKLRQQLDARIGRWEARRSTEREARLTKLVGIVAEMSPEKSAALVSGIEPELGVDLLIRLDTVKAGAILSLLPPERAAEMAGAISARKR